MRHVFLLACMTAATSLHLAACAQPMNQPESQSAPVAGKVSDMAAFERYIATRPTPAQFRAHYPDVLLVLPGDMATKELRMDHSRYFAQLDADGRITGGRFQ
ncbi:MAG TPA: hypothetical protein VLI06_10665 [Solimonas sp.]|nr:hypothetical protein [Solimonas sp.]